MNRVAAILSACGTADAHLPATTLYNEGWMLRLVLDWFSRQPKSTHPLAFSARARWYSEALLPSQFLARRRGDLLAEAYTHADGAIGHFYIGHSGAGDLALDANATQLVIAEAKMYSGLSAGIKKAPAFNQAARSVACIAELLYQAKRPPQAFSRLGFCVLAPDAQIHKLRFAELLDKEALWGRVAERVKSFGGTKEGWFDEWFVPTLETAQVAALSWEAILQHIAEHDPESAADLTQFYEQCLRYKGPLPRAQTA